MGAWNTAINGNDTFLDIYQNFFDLYNQGQNPIDISKELLANNPEVFLDTDERNNGLFALVLAQWETKSLSRPIFEEVKEIIKTENDLIIWRQLGADDETLKKRKVELDKFLAEISQEKEKAKRRVKPKNEFSYIETLVIKAPDTRKSFTVIESFTNKIYQNTSSMIMWSSSGGAVFSFVGQNKFNTAKWLDNQTIEITHDKDIIFTKKELLVTNGDVIKIIYKSE
jgi:hypothetical protein